MTVLSSASPRSPENANCRRYSVGETPYVARNRRAA
jgi:hypothetical protein